jgi:predicted RNA-binding protein Jag
MNKSDEEKQIEAKIWEFYENKEAKSMEFPDTFNSYHRSIVHRVSEEYGLNHESSGVGKERKILISKPDQETKDFKDKLTLDPE